MQRLHSSWDPSFGGSIAHRGGDGSTSEVRYEHGPAYPITVTMQSVLAQVVQDHVSITHAQPIEEGWNVSGAVDVAFLRANPDSVGGALATDAVRMQASLTFGRLVAPGLTLGLATRALSFSRATPLIFFPGGSMRLYWDPRYVVSSGPYLQLTRDLSATWRLSGNLGPGVALIAERGSPGSDVIPHVSAEAGVRREGSRFWTALDLFYYQGQFDGYRTYGARLTLSARDFSSLTRP